MSKQTQVQIEKPAAAPAAPASTPLTAKEQRAADRAKRYPSEAKKEAEKVAAKADKPAGKPAATPLAQVKKEQAKFVNRTVKKGAPVYLISVGARPQGGSRLFAHTHAALALFGMFDASCPPAPKAAVLAFMGQTAVSYHLKENNFVDGAKGISLTPAGRSKFMQRLLDNKFDTKVAMAFQNLFVDGKADPLTQVNQKDIYPHQFTAA